MRKLWMTVVAAALVVAPTWAAARPHERTHVEAVSYVHPYGVWAADHAGADMDDLVDGIVLTPLRRDRSVSITTEDLSGQPVMTSIHQDGGHGHPDLDEQFCQPRAEFDLVSSEPVVLHVYNGFCINHVFGFATQGTITATFSNLTTRGGSTHLTHDHG